MLEAEGYRVHSGTKADGLELVGRFWFTWRVPAMADCEVGPTCSGPWDAWASALDHRLSNSRIEVHQVSVASSPLEPFHPAVVPEEVLDVRSFAARYGLSEEVASAQISRLFAQAIYMNDRYQVNVEVVDAPFGEETGDVLRLSIKRRDKAPVHDWRELQQIKAMSQA
ncbi:MAG: hypothetical protein HZC37_23570 [Burkholderiales bacterium]|nr:hypothetical protein [Burkholderiales bacterium]